MSDKIILNRAARDIRESPELLPISQVKLTGKDEEGNEVVFTSGTTSGRTLEVNVPWATQEMADSILSKVWGYEYKPYTADGAILDPAAELGDAIRAGDVYSVIASTETTFSPIMSSTVSAPEDSQIDHEIPYYDKQEREQKRYQAETYERIESAKASFEVTANSITQWVKNDYETKTDAETTKVNLETTITTTAEGIRADVKETYQTISDATTQTTNLETLINTTAEGITQTVSETYELKTDADTKLTDAKSYADDAVETASVTITEAYQSEIEQTARSIRSTVAAATQKYENPNPNDITISYYGFGDPQDAGIENPSKNQYYLDQTTGNYWKYNGTRWNKSGTFPLVTDNIRSEIVQTASEIKSTIAGSISQYDTTGYDDIEFYDFGSPSSELAVGNNGKYYLDQETGDIYKSNGTRWTWQETLPLISNGFESMIQQTMSAITLSVQSDSNGSTITLTSGNVSVSSETVNLHVDAANIDGAITAKYVAAEATITSPSIYGGTFYNSNGSASLEVGYDLIFNSRFTSDEDYDAFLIRDDAGSVEMSMYGDHILTYDVGNRRITSPRDWRFLGTIKFTGTVDLSDATVIMPEE